MKQVAHLYGIKLLILFIGLMDLNELSALKDLSEELRKEEIVQLRNVLGIPEALSENVQEGTQFLLSLNRWSGHNPFHFYEAIMDVRPELASIACDIPWLCVSSPNEFEYKIEELSIKTLIDLLKTEIKTNDWQLIYMSVSKEAGEQVGFEVALRKLLEKKQIKNDLSQLSHILESIKRNDVVEKLKSYKNVFSGMEEGEFVSKFMKEIGIQTKEQHQWEDKLKEFMHIQHKKVKQMIGSDEIVSLEHVYVDLTILKQKPREINLKDESTYNEIAFLRKITNKEVRIKPIDFTKELTSYKPTESEIWCLIGNPGCGKTFLTKRIALRFSSSELADILYTISIPCRNPDWHAMESTRYEAKLEIEDEFISKWLCLGLPRGANWSKSLSKHLSGADGEGLLLVIDGLDEFTKKVPFKNTILHSLLTRLTLTKSTIILTSRPGAWTELSSAHELKIDRFYQVLGFSPANRDLYFTKQIENDFKLKECWRLLARYEEMKQLSLIPVNASLFAALFRGEDYTSISTLTNLYYQLTLYLIRRELSRLGLEVLSRVVRISYLHTDVVECLKRIAFIAFLGVANRELASEENVTLIIGKEEFNSNCLGLTHEHYKKSSVGQITRVWTFPHLTLQEFSASIWLKYTSWTEQCLSIRYISHSSDNFSLFKMVVRFLCGFLCGNSAALITILYRQLTPQPIQLIDLPMTYQLMYDEIYGFNTWYEFTELYFQLVAILFETNTASIPVFFNHCKQYLPFPVYLYIREAKSPNEWICFLKSLQLVSQFQLIYIKTGSINLIQFKAFLGNMKFCSVNTLALSFASKSYTALKAYTKLIEETKLELNTRISLHLANCDLRDPSSVNLFTPIINQMISSLQLTGNKYSNPFLQQLSNQMSAINNLYVDAPSSEYSTLVQAVCQATQLRVLHITHFTNECIDLLRAALPQFSKLQEIRFEYYLLIPAIINLSNLTYIQFGYFRRDIIRNISKDLLQLMKGNTNTLRGLRLGNLHGCGFENLSLFLDCLELCTNLVELKLRHILLQSSNANWYGTINKLKLLTELHFSYVFLYNEGFLSLCEGLVYHPAIKSITLENCTLSSKSCEPLMNLIPTTPCLEYLYFNKLSSPDREPILLLSQTADEYSIEHYFA